jgi:hypothetical protein
MKVKQFDCIKMKELGSQQVYEKIKDMSIQEELIYWEKASQRLRNLQNQQSNHESDKP